jgi:predicted RNase H-like nuclease (RuvC/YqgF family)
VLTGVPGSYFINSHITLKQDQKAEWDIVLNVNQNHMSENDLNNKINRTNEIIKSNEFKLNEKENIIEKLNKEVSNLKIALDELVQKSDHLKEGNDSNLNDIKKNNYELTNSLQLLQKQ